jgi:hypothetical protein
MLKIIVLCAAFIANIAAAEPPSREVVYLGMNECPQGGCPSPRFDRGYLIQMHGYAPVPPDGFTLYDPDGREIYQVDVHAPDGTPARLRGSAVDSDGTAGVSFTYGGQGREAVGAIVLVDRNGNQRLFTDTGHWLPQNVGFAPDHSIWAMGEEYRPPREGIEKHWMEKREYSVVRKYSASGKLEGEYLARSTFPPGLPPASSGIGWIRVLKDRVGAITYPGMISNNPEYIELNLDGIAGRWQLGPDFVFEPGNRATLIRTQPVVTADGRLWAKKCPETGKCVSQLVMFDKETSTWQPSKSLPPQVQELLVPGGPRLIGAEGNELAFEKRSGGVRLIWFSLLP